MKKKHAPNTIFQHRFVTHWHRHPFFLAFVLLKNDMIFFMCACVFCVVMMDQMVYAHDYWLYVSINTVALTQSFDTQFKISFD